MRATAFTQLFSLRYPIMQAPMGSVSSPELVAAVSNAGGMGMLAVAGLPPDMIRVQIRRVRALTTRPFGANLLLPVLQPGQAEACIEERVPLLSLYWGDPAPYVEAAHRAGVIVMLQVGSPEEATAAREAGVDLIAAQGVEAGGHVRGTITTLVLVPLVVDAVHPIPVLAAGGKHRAARHQHGKLGRAGDQRAVAHALQAELAQRLSAVFGGIATDTATEYYDSTRVPRLREIQRRSLVKKTHQRI